MRTILFSLVKFIFPSIHNKHYFSILSKPLGILFKFDTGQIYCFYIPLASAASRRLSFSIPASRKRQAAYIYTYIYTYTQIHGKRALENRESTRHFLLSRSSATVYIRRAR